MLIKVDNRETDLFPLIERRIDTIDILEKESASESNAKNTRSNVSQCLIPTHLYCDVDIVPDCPLTLNTSNALKSGENDKSHKIKKEQLHIGDIVLEDKTGKTVIIFERKTLYDLAASIKDGRYNEQSFRLDKEAIHNHNIVYIIEGDLSRYDERHTQITKTALQSAMVSLMYYKGFSVYRTMNTDETEAFIVNFADKIQSNSSSSKNETEMERSGGLGYYRRRMASVSSPAPGKILGESDDGYSEVAVTKEKRDFITPKNIGEIMLSNIPGVSPKIAAAIMKKYNNSKYSLWQRKHEIDISLNTKVEKQYVHIDSNIQNLKDLITIINNNEYLENTDYNIDLKSLHNIKKELVEMDSMIGMESMKKSVLFQLLYFVQELHVGKNTSDFKHTVIYGPPGTGKTEIAKIIGQMYSKMGILKNNVFKKVTRNDLIAGYLGQTALKTRKVIDECIGGVLFIDEAYSLANSENNDSYSKECIDILCEALSAHKDELMVIIAGYEEELEETFFKANRGLESRFIWRFKIDSYNSQEMMKIFKKKVKDNEWEFENEDELKEVWFEKKKDDFKNFGRDMELLFSYVKVVHGRRIYGKDKSLRKKITLEDLNSGYDTMLKNKKNKKQTQEFMHSIFI
jgi:ERCC4-type nuclease